MLLTSIPNSSVKSNLPVSTGSERYPANDALKYSHTSSIKTPIYYTSSRFWLLWWLTPISATSRLPSPQEQLNTDTMELQS